jgi:hypothetical protein
MITKNYENYTYNKYIFNRSMLNDSRSKIIDCSIQIEKLESVRGIPQWEAVLKLDPSK